MAVMLAKNYDGSDPTGWWMSEKLDGVRAIWKDGQLLSRNDKPFVAPKWFTEGLPRFLPLDGELWIDRGKFQETVSIVRKTVNIDEDAWNSIKYMVFDTPITQVRVQERFKVLKALSLPSFVKVIPHSLCKGIDHLQEYYFDLLENDAEGVMLNAPNSLYEFKRSGNLRKYKPNYPDEAIVTGYQPGDGKYTGLVGALLCQWGDRPIVLGSGLSDEDRINPPPVGTTVTFKYFGLTDGGNPRFPIYVVERDYE